MVITKPNALGPNTNPGQIVVVPTGGYTYQERIETRTANIPNEYASPLTTLRTTGIVQPGIAQYTNP